MHADEACVIRILFWLCICGTVCFSIDKNPPTCFSLHVGAWQFNVWGAGQLCCCCYRACIDTEGLHTGCFCVAVVFLTGTLAHTHDSRACLAALESFHRREATRHVRQHVCGQWVVCNSSSNDARLPHEGRMCVASWLYATAALVWFFRTSLCCTCAC